MKIYLCYCSVGKSLLPTLANSTKHLSETIQTRNIAILLFKMLGVYKSNRQGTLFLIDRFNEKEKYVTLMETIKSSSQNV